MNPEQATSILDRVSSSDPEDAVYQPNGDYKAFGISRHAVSLNCIKRDGNQTGISWSLYSDACYDPAQGVMVEFSHKLVTIEGTLLLPLYQFILGNRVSFIAEADQATEKLSLQDQNAVVSRLTVEDRGTPV